MSSNLERICTVDIEISSPIVDSAAFDAVLIVGPAPAKPNGEIPPVTVYSSAQEAQDAGYVTTGDDADPVGRAINVAFSQSPKPTAVYVATQQPAPAPDPDETTDPPATGEDGGSNPDTPKETGGENEGAEVAALAAADDGLEALGVTLARALETNGWYFICPAGISEDRYEEIAEWTEAQTKMFAYTTMSETPPVRNVYFRTFGFYGREYVGQPENEIPAANYFLHVAACAKILRYDPGSETWVFKALASISPSKIKTATVKKFEEANLNYFNTVASRNITMLGKTASGEWIDLIRFRDWLQNDMQVRVVNLLVTNKKIPYTDGGIGLVQNQMIASLKAGQQAGGIAPTEYDEDQNEIPGYVTKVPLAANLTAVQKASRKLKGVSFQARIAGAIHMVEINGNLTYDNL